VLVEGGMPDGSDRPLVYTRRTASSGNSYPVNIPAYSAYDRSQPPAKLEPNGAPGDFRDVSGWAPADPVEPPTK
jgi:hypothetical protein